MKNKTIIPILTLLIACLILVWFLSFRQLQFSQTDFSQSCAVTDNPYCGFYHMYGFMLSDSKSTEQVSEYCKQLLNHDENQLFLIEINIKEYNSAPISLSALDQLNAVLDEFEESKKQVILRFLYDWDGKALVSEPDDINIILNHMEQISSSVNAHKKSVILLQGNFTGNVGEMNNTKYGDATSMKKLFLKLNDVIDSDVFLSVRTPAHRRIILEDKNTISSSQAFDSSLYSRLGLFNDGMMGSVYDLGTYSATPYSPDEVGFPSWNRVDELNFQNQLCLYVPNGGEVVIDNEYNDFDNAIENLSCMHVSYLNSDYDPVVINKWKNSIYTGDDCFYESNGYDYIKTHLGYRYYITNAYISHSQFSRRPATLNITINNSGFAPSYRLFDTSISLISDELNKSVDITSDFDNRYIEPDSSSNIEIPINIYALEKGTWKIYLEMKDSYTDKSISFANECDDNKKILVGTLLIQ